MTTPTRTGRGTKGPHRRTRCDHMPTGTVAWPPQQPPVGEVAASVYSCRDEVCVQDAAVWVWECTGQMGVYREFEPGWAA